jgi:hypothetical protein
LGLAFTFHVEPFQCSVRVWNAKGDTVCWETPTAQTSQGDSADTEFRTFEYGPTFGGCAPQAWQVPAAAEPAEVEASHPLRITGNASRHRAHRLEILRTVSFLPVRRQTRILGSPLDGVKLTWEVGGTDLASG